MEEQKELNLVEILKDCPKGTKLWSPCWGNLIYNGIDWKEYEAWKSGNCVEGAFPILTEWADEEIQFTPSGKYIDSCDVMLFPSKENRDWSTFKVEKPKWNPNTLQPFDKVLVRDSDNNKWLGDFFIGGDVTIPRFQYYCMRSGWRYCIPFNDDTKHLLGTSDEAPEYYRQ